MEPDVYFPSLGNILSLSFIFSITPLYNLSFNDSTVFSSDIDSSFDIISYRLSKVFEKKGDISIVSYRNGNFHIVTSLIYTAFGHSLQGC